MAEDQQGSNKGVTSSPCSSPPSFPFHFPIFPSADTTLGPGSGDTHGPMTDSSEKWSERLQPLLTKPVYTDGGRLHYFCEGRGGGGEAGRLAEFIEVVYKLEEGQGLGNVGSEPFQWVTHDQPFHHRHHHRHPTFQQLLSSHDFNLTVNHLKCKQITVGSRIICFLKTAIFS